MIWVVCSIIYCIVCLLAVLYLRRSNKKREPGESKFGFKEWVVLILVFPFIILFFPIWFPYILFQHFRDKRKRIMKDKEEEKRENELKAKIGLRPDENYLCFSRMGGAGAIECADCGYQEKIISFTHGMTSCNIGRQCPKCHAFTVEYNESEHYHTFGDSKEDFVCPKCGTVIRKKEESIFKGNDDPLFCPKCHSARLYYHMHYIT